MFNKFKDRLDDNIFEIKQDIVQILTRHLSASESGELHANQGNVSQTIRVFSFKVLYLMKFASTFIQLVTITNLIPFEVVH